MYVVTLVVPAAWVCDSSFQYLGLLPSPCWAVDDLVFCIGRSGHGASEDLEAVALEVQLV